MFGRGSFTIVPKFIFVNLCRISTSNFNKFMSTSKSTYPRILSIQSHIVHGYVGNKASTFPLQSLGFNVDAINTVHLSNHPSYPGGFKGQALNGEEFDSLIKGLESNELLNVDVIISGYISKKDVLTNLPRVIQTVRQKNPKVLYVCDPVLGDRGTFYVPRDLLDIYIKDIVPLSDAVCPNIFEAEVLTGIPIKTINDAILACNKIHEMGVNICLLKGIPLSGPDGPLTMFLSSKELGSVYKIDVPRVDGHFSGTGDLCTAVFTAWYYKSPNDLGKVLDNVATTLYSVVSDTRDRNSKELCIVENLETYRSPPPPTIPSHLIAGPVTGVIFDMDGTLTEAGAIDFARMRSRTGLSADRDILTQIAELPEDQRKAAYTVVVEEEMIGCEKMAIRPDTAAILAALRERRIRTAVATRNSFDAYERFQNRLEVEPPLIPDNSTSEFDSSVFSVVLTRETLGGVNKPDPRVATHILEAWNLDDEPQVTSPFVNKGGPSSVWFVGDHDDDVTCGRLAGCKTCLIVPPHVDKSGSFPNTDLAVHSLSEFLDVILKR